MRLALSLGRRGQGRVWPNPAVGCVIVQGTRIVGRGWTQDGGRPHAEPIALAQAGKNARGATAYVTLEPCSHHGETPPCAQALIDAGVARVVCALQDQDGRVNGQGFAMLRAAGIEVITGICAEEAARDHAGFLLKTTQSRPFLTLKLALSLDGRIATKTGHSQWITGGLARREVHGMRMRHDAVMVGGGTLRADDPALTVRGLGASRQPVRVVIGRAAKLPLESTLITTAGVTPTWVVHSDDAAPLAGTAATSLPYQGDLRDAMGALAAKGLTRVFCEGGGGLAAALLAQDLVDEIIGFSAGMAIGGDGTAAIAPFGVKTLDQAQRFSLIESRAVGVDLMHRWRR